MANTRGKRLADANSNLPAPTSKRLRLELEDAGAEEDDAAGGIEEPAKVPNGKQHDEHKRKAALSDDEYELTIAKRGRKHAPDLQLKLKIILRAPTQNEEERLRRAKAADDNRIAAGEEAKKAKEEKAEARRAANAAGGKGRRGLQATQTTPNVEESNEAAAPKKKSTPRKATAKTSGANATPKKSKGKGAAASNATLVQKKAQKGGNRKPAGEKSAKKPNAHTTNEKKKRGSGTGPGARKPSWLLTTRDPNVHGSRDRIFFYAQSRYYGGPFAFMSSWFRCEFRDPEVHKTHVFTSLAQYLCYAQALMIGIPRARTNEHGLSSKDLDEAILMIACVSDMKWLCRSFQKLKGEEWGRAWEGPWKAGNLTLKDKLMKTGIFPLYDAARGDKTFGIGFNAENALSNRSKWGKNLHGLAMQKTRQTIRDEEPGVWSDDCDVQHFREIEKEVERRLRENKLNKARKRIQKDTKVALPPSKDEVD